MRRFWLISILLAGCIDPYPAPDITEDISILVVDGFINASDGSATVKLTQAVSLDEKDEYPPERAAAVTIRSENGGSFTLTEQEPGNYKANGITVDPASMYQLNIRTSDNRVITSDYVRVMQTPPIDSITWRPEEDGITVLVNTHDDTKRSRYYYWDYVETWEYKAPFAALYTTKDHAVIYVEEKDRVYTCYRTQPSTDIVIGSTFRLTEDVVRDFPLTSIKRESSRLSVLYSIKVRQRVIDEEEYDFMLDLQRVTEGIGGLFDSQPYKILGNLYATDSQVPVLGFFRAGFVQERRIFISLLDLPEYLQERPYHYCVLDTVCGGARGPDSPYNCSVDVSSLPDSAFLVSSFSWGYTMTTAPCADCRYQGGVLAKPDFWP